MFRCLLYYTSDWADYRGNLCSKCWSTCHRFYSDQHESRCMACCIWHESYKDYSCGVGLYYCFENSQYVDHNVRSASNLMFLRRVIGSCIVYKFGDFCSISAYSEHVLVLRYLNAIQTMCPHILRYLTTAVITNRRRRQAHHQQLLKDLVKVIQQVRCGYILFMYRKIFPIWNLCLSVMLSLLLVCTAGTYSSGQTSKVTFDWFTVYKHIWFFIT